MPVSTKRLGYTILNDEAEVFPSSACFSEYLASSSEFQMKKKALIYASFLYKWVSQSFMASRVRWFLDGMSIGLQTRSKMETWLFFKAQKRSSFHNQYTKLTFTPTQADRFVLVFRNWLRRHVNSQPEWLSVQQPLPSTVLSKRQMLDRFEQSTLWSVHCENKLSQHSKHGKRS